MINNAGFLVASSGVISIDACSTERRTRAYLEAIGRVTDQPVRTLINTHHHADHTFGNYLFSGATIVGHTRVREAILRADRLAAHLPGWEHVDFGALQMAPPTLTYENGVTLWSDQLRCDLHYVGRPAHTTDDSVLWIPEHSVLFAGDLIFNGVSPFLLMGSIAGALQTLDELEALGATTIVPGHGAVGGPELFEQNRSYIRFVQRLAAQAKSAGLTPLEASREADLGDYAELLDPERVVGNLHRAYLEIDGAELGAPIDLAAVHLEMIAYNGGRPLRCDA